MFLKAAGGILLSAVLCLILAKQGKDFSLLITIAVCCMVITAAACYIEPIIDFIRKLQDIGDLDTGMVETVLKAVGIGLLAQIVNLICTDAGNASLGKALQILATTVILLLAIPLFTNLLELAETILGRV